MSFQVCELSSLVGSYVLDQTGTTPSGYLINTTLEQHIHSHYAAKTLRPCLGNIWILSVDRLMCALLDLWMREEERGTNSSIH